MKIKPEKEYWDQLMGALWMHHKHSFKFHGVLEAQGITWLGFTCKKCEEQVAVTRINFYSVLMGFKKAYVEEG